MDLSYSAEYEAFRVEVAKFLAASWPLRGAEAELSWDQKASLFRGRAIAAGYLARSIPKRYGGSEQAADVLKAQVIREEFFRARAPGDLAGIGPSMLVPTLLEKGADPNLADHGGWSPLLYASAAGHGQLVHGPVTDPVRGAGAADDVDNGVLAQHQRDPRGNEGHSRR